MSRRRDSDHDRSASAGALPESSGSPDLLIERIADRVVDRLTRSARPLLLPSPGRAAGDIRVVVAKEIVLIASLDPYLTLEATADYGGVSVRWLRSALTDPVHPLPCYRPGGRHGKVLVRRSEFDAWMAQFRAVGDVDLNAMVTEVLRDVV